MLLSKSQGQLLMRHFIKSDTHTPSHTHTHTHTLTHTHTFSTQLKFLASTEAEVNKLKRALAMIPHLGPRYSPRGSCRSIVIFNHPSWILTRNTHFNASSEHTTKHKFRKFSINSGHHKAKNQETKPSQSQQTPYAIRKLTYTRNPKESGLTIDP